MRRVILTVLALAAIGGCHKQGSTPPQATSPADAAVPAAADPGTKVVTLYAGKHGPDNAFDGPDGKPTRIADFKGKPLLVNFWATWCVPCVREMPALDALAVQQAGKLNVVAINEGLEKPDRISGFWKSKGFRQLKLYIDRTNGLMMATHEAGLPVTILYDRDGKEIWRVEGPLDWTSPKGKELIAKAGI